ncbi:hypothetical protein D9M71_547950 [compost metagenome]
MNLIRHAALGQRLLDLGEHLGAELEAAVAFRLHDTEQLRLRVPDGASQGLALAEGVDAGA